LAEVIESYLATPYVIGVNHQGSSSIGICMGEVCPVDALAHGERWPHKNIHRTCAIYSSWGCISSHFISLPLQFSVTPSEVKPEAKKSRRDCDDDPYPNPGSVAKPSTFTEKRHCEDGLDKVKPLTCLLHQNSISSLTAKDVPGRKKAVSKAT
jgi:hypothetical protein